MKISLIIPTKNRKDDLIKSLYSVIEQSFLPFEIIIVDQSDDLSSKKSVESTIKPRLKNVKLRYIYDPTIKGLVHAKYVATLIAESEVNCFIEDDVVLDKDFLKYMRQGFIDKPEAVGFCGVIKEVPKSHTNTLYIMFHKLFHRGIFKDNRVGIHGCPRRCKSDIYQSASTISGGVSAFISEAHDKVPFEIDSPFFMFEDVEISHRMKKYFGKDKFFFNKSALLHHAASPINRDILTTRIEKKCKEVVLFYKKFAKDEYSFLNTAWLLLGILIEASIKTIKYKNYKPIKSFVRGISIGIRQDYKL